MRLVPKPRMVTFGLRMRALRKAAGITQGELADRIDYSRTSIVNIEAGRQGLPILALMDIAHELGAPIATFFDDSETGSLQAPRNELAEMRGEIRLLRHALARVGEIAAEATHD